MLGNLLREKGCQPVVALPYDEVRGVRAVDNIGGVDVAAALLLDALVQPLRARALDAHGDAGKFCSNVLASRSATGMSMAV